MIRIKGWITHGSGTRRVSRVFENRFADGFRNFVFDVSEVTYVDSSGILAFVMPPARAKMRLGNVTFVEPTWRVRQLLEVIKLDQIMEVYETVEAALSRLTGVPPESIPKLKYKKNRERVEVKEGEEARQEWIQPKGFWPKWIKTTDGVGVDAPSSLPQAPSRDTNIKPPVEAKTESNLLALLTSGLLILLIFSGTVVTLVWAAQQVPFLVLSMLLAIAIIFQVNAIVFILVISGALEQKSAVKLLRTSLGKVPGLRFWIPKLWPHTDKP